MNKNNASGPLFRKMRIRRGPLTEHQQHIEDLRRITPPHSRKSCGGCLGFYQNGKLIRHRTIPASKLL